MADHGDAVARQKFEAWAEFLADVFEGKAVSTKVNGEMGRNGLVREVRDEQD